MKLYDMTMAPNPRRVRIFLAEKGMSLEMPQVDIAKGENHSPDYRAINPRGVVPTLVLDDGSILDESVAICRYLEGLHPEPNLMGRDPLEVARIESWQRRIEFDGLFTVAGIFRNEAPHMAGRAVQGNAPPTEQSPEMAARCRLLLPHFLATLDARLGESAYVAGDRYTIADITTLVTIDFAKWVKVRVPDEHANTRRWYAEVSARPSAKA